MMPLHLPQKKDYLWGLLVAVWALFVYLLTLAPTVTGEDSGELAAAAYEFGVAHPPGYPLWCLAGKLSTLLPVGDIAWRTNFLSAVLGALTVAGVFFLLRRMEIHPAAAWGGALCLAFSLRFWSQSVITEVYTLNTFLFVCILNALFAWVSDEEKKMRWLLVAAGVFGLSLANHYMLALLVSPAYLPFLWQKRKDLYSRKSVFAYGAVLILAGLAIYLYLPLAAHAEPFVNWGDPSTWERFWAHILRTSYKDLEHGTVVGSMTKLLFFGHAGVEILWQFTPWLILFVAWGARFLWREHRTVFLSSGAVVLLNIFVLILLLSFTFEQENRQRVEVYYLPAYCMLALWLGLGFDRLLARIRGVWGYGYKQCACVFLVMCLPAIPLLYHWQHNDFSRFTIARTFAEKVIEQVEPGAVVFPSSDAVTFPLLYLIATEGNEKNILIGDKYGELDREVLTLYESLPRPDGRVTAAEIQQHIICTSGRAVYYTDRQQAPHMPGVRLVPWGLLYRAVPQNSATPVRAFQHVTLFAFDGLKRAGTSDDAMERSLAAAVWRMQGEDAYARGDTQKGTLCLREARTICRDSKEGLNNLGSVFAQYGQEADAEACWLTALRLYPVYLTPHLNLTSLYLRRKEMAKAARHLAEARHIAPNHAGVRRLSARIDGQQVLRPFYDAIKREPENPVVHNNLACKLAEQKRFREAEQAWLHATTLDASYAPAHKNLSILYRNDLLKPARAKLHAETFERLTKDQGK